MVLVLISVTTFYTFGSFGPVGIVPQNQSAAVGPGGIVPENQSGSVIPSTGVMNSEQNEKKS